MAANAFFMTTVLILALGLWLLQECDFLIPYKAILAKEWGQAIGGYTVLLFINLFAAILRFSSTFLLKNTGRKLAHLEKQLRTGNTISDELSDRLKEDQ